VFFQHCLVFCRLQVEHPQTVTVLQRRDIVTWQSIILCALCLEESNISRKWSAYCLGRLLNLSEAGIPPTLLDQPWGDSAEDITPSELRSIYSALFNVQLGEPRVVGKSGQQCLETSLNESVLFKDTPIQHISEWYETITAQIPIFLPVWFEEPTPRAKERLTHQVIPLGITPMLGIRVLSKMRRFMYVTGTIVPHISNLTECSSNAEAKCPSLRDHKNSFLLILVFHGLWPSGNDALDGWTISHDGQNLYHSLMNTFLSTKKAAEYSLILAVFLCVPLYCMMSSIHGPHQISNDPLPDLGNFVEGQGPVNRRMILEETAFAAIRVLMNEEKPQQTEHKYLSTVIMYAVSKSQPTLGCSAGILDRYCEARIDSLVDHAEAFRISQALVTANLPPGLLYEDRSDSEASFSCSPTTSSTTLNGSIYDTTSSTTPKGSITTPPATPTRGICGTTSSTLKGSICDTASSTLKGSICDTTLPATKVNRVFTVQFVGRPCVGKSEIINRVSRAPRVLIFVNTLVGRLRMLCQQIQSYS
jgi:hypothetical protein